MTANELFAATPPDHSSRIMADLLELDRQAYRTALATLASRRNLRVQFLDKKSKADRHRWMAESLSRKRNEDLALEILQNWILRCQSAMVLAFLDQLDIAHNGEGIIEDTPAEPNAARVDAAVAFLLANFPAEAAAIYLHLFSSMDPEGWKHLRHLLSTHPELQLGALSAQNEPAPATPENSENTPADTPAPISQQPQQ
jgi:hypothetical protein